jgi:hypothetical protein
VTDQDVLAFYEPRLLRERPPPAAVNLAMKARSGRLAFYVGAERRAGEAGGRRNRTPAVKPQAPLAAAHE